MNEIVNPVQRLSPEQMDKFLGPGPVLKRYLEGLDLEPGQAPAHLSGLTCTSAIVHDASDANERTWLGAASGTGCEPTAAATKDADISVCASIAQPRTRRYPSSRSSSRSTATAPARSRQAKSPCRKLTNARAIGVSAASTSTTQWSGGRTHHQQRSLDISPGCDKVCTREWAHQMSFLWK